MTNNLKTPLDPVPISEYFPTKPQRPQQQDSSVLRKTQNNGKLEIRARPSTCDIILMLPPCIFIGCCFSVSADVVFDDDTSSVSISNWPGLLCCFPCKQSTVIPYEDIANIGMRNTNIKQGQEGNEQPLFDVMLVTRSGKLWRVGSRGFSGEVSAQVEALHYHIFGRNNPEYKRVWGFAQQIPSADWCCF